MAACMGLAIFGLNIEVELELSLQNGFEININQRFKWVTHRPGDTVYTGKLRGICPVQKSLETCEI